MDLRDICSVILLDYRIFASSKKIDLRLRQEERSQQNLQ